FAELSTRVDLQTLARGKTVFFVGNARQAEHDPALLLGDITAISVRVMPWHYHLIRAPRKEIMMIPNWEERVIRWRKPP
ncbi:MAG: hypothetical protein HC802_14500, partial [Caldilineaceae bacterium]|nr:hypothetical protein [Caldilineaceae bacterium]